MLSLLLALPPRSVVASEVPPGLSGDERTTLLGYARSTWHSFEVMAQPEGLPVDGLTHGGGSTWTPSLHTSPTNIAAYLWSTLAAEALDLIGRDEARRRLTRTLGTVGRLERAHGFFLNWYDARTGATLRDWPLDGKPLRPFLSTVDNGWLAAALMMVKNTHPTLRAQAEGLLEPMDFGFFYQPYDAADPTRHAGLLRLGYWTDEHAFANTYGMVNTEPRIASYIGIARGQLPPEHYYRIGRCRQSWRGAQEQVPEGVTRSYLGVPVFESHYTYRGMRIVPSWGGSMFEALMVPLLVPEARWAPRSWGTNHPLYVHAQITYGLEEAGYGFWGFSPASRPEGGYGNYGVDALGAEPDGYPAEGVVTPHASFLALAFTPHEAVANLRNLVEKFPIYGPFGFHDSVNVSTGVVSPCVLALDQGMIMAALANALADAAMQRAFADAQFQSVVRPLLAREEFTAGS